MNEGPQPSATQPQTGVPSPASFIPWVATGPHAVGFYRSCGWLVEQELELSKDGGQAFILSKSL